MDNTIDNSVLNISTLEKEYDMYLKQYQEAYKNYINILNTSSLGKELIELPGKTWWGTYGIKEGTVNSKEECISMCASNSSCTGATFNSVKRYCWTRGGDGIVTPGMFTDSALIPKIKEVLLTLSDLNNKLLSINEELRAEAENVNPRFEEDKVNNEIQKKIFDQYYNELYYDKTQMEKMMDEYNSINAELNDQTLFVNQQNLSLMLWTLFTLILCFFVIKKMKGPSNENTSTDSIINKVFLFLVLICIFSINKQIGFDTMGIILISFLIYKLYFSG
jgi:hypothetical protein